ncbi:precorrin-6Y C5,15-methyltransferase (decarboxylating) subunit CbiT [Halopenitus sp. H-Gu1]|uniref:precorrin-6Y C5,15-methyltransferase (decarboxylating) subunit CbiT n=1 Tax=Halopenitus sp. H-Gu1 TaxID=3242697 RepID=UPI00359CE9D4
MANVSLPHDAKAGPTKPEVRAVLLDKLDLDTTDHFVDVGSCTGAVTVEAARRADRVTAIERKPERLTVTERNLAANGIDAARTPADSESGDAGSADSELADVVLCEAAAPTGIPSDANVLFLGGSRNYEAVLDRALEIGVDRVIMNVSRLEVAGAAAEAFRDRGLLEGVLQFQVSHGYELAGATSFDSDNPVYMLIGGVDGTDDSIDDTVAADGGER